jgi:cytidine deaminase
MKKLAFVFSLLLIGSVFSTTNTTVKSHLEDWKKNLILKAIEARKNTYSPYSHYAVGAAALGKSGKIYLGTNVENAAYGSTICAERSAIVSGVSQGEKDFSAIALVTQNGGFPCGSCRQFLNEFNPDMLVIVSDVSMKNIEEKKLSDLLPDAFGPKQLQ